jgi:peroxiredoxin
MRCILIFILIFSFDHAFSQTITEAGDSAYLSQMQAFFDNNENLPVPDSVKRQNLYNELRSSILKHPADEINFGMIYYWGLNLTYKQVDTLLGLIDPSLHNSPQRATADMILERLSVAETGKPFPPLTLKDTAGIVSNLSALKGKIVLIDVWSAGCVPCREQIPGLRKLYKKYNSKGFEMIGVSMDSNKQDWLKAISKDKQSWKEYCELVNWRANTFAKRFSVWSIPSNFLIDQDGILVGQNLSTEALRSWIEQHHL